MALDNKWGAVYLGPKPPSLIWLYIAFSPKILHDKRKKCGGKEWQAHSTPDHPNAFIQDAIVITTYDFAADNEEAAKVVNWDLTVFEEANALSPVYQEDNKQGKALKWIAGGSFKLLLTIIQEQASAHFQKGGLFSSPVASPNCFDESIIAVDCFHLTQGFADSIRLIW